MQARTKALIIAVALPILAAVIIVAGPSLIAHAFKAWAVLQLQHAGCELRVGKIEAHGWFAPGTFRDVEITNRGVAAATFDIRIQDGAIRLQPFGATFSNARFIRRLDLRGVEVVAHDTRATIRWQDVARFLADEIHVQANSISVERGATALNLRDVTFAAGRPADRLRIGLFSITAPLFRQEFRAIDAATDWKNNRLTLGVIALGSGLQVDSINFDAARLSEGRVGVEITAAIFSGKLRATLASQPAADGRVWDVAASTTELSFAALGEAVGLRDPLSGHLHASKFTFHGDPQHAFDATSSVWLELTDLKFRDRAADVLMLGAVVYNREVELQQLYVKQQANELTLTGETTLRKSFLNSEFRGDVSGKINDLGAFARLFGAPAAQFGGAITLVGSVRTRERKVSGELRGNGEKLTLFGAEFDRADANISLDASAIAFESTARRAEADDVALRGTGTIAGDAVTFDEITAALDETEFTFSGRARQIGDALAIDLTPTSALWIAKNARALSCIAGVAAAIGADRMAVRDLTINTETGVDFHLSESDGGDALTLPFCEATTTDARPLEIAPEP